MSMSLYQGADLNFEVQTAFGQKKEAISAIDRDWRQKKAGRAVLTFGLLFPTLYVSSPSRPASTSSVLSGSVTEQCW